MLLEETPVTSFQKPIVIIYQLIKKLSLHIVVYIDYARDSFLLRCSYMLMNCKMKNGKSH